MSSERPDMRLSDAERETVVAQLNAAVAEGRLTLAEFEERVDGVLRSRTHGELEPYVGDLPVQSSARVPDVLPIRSRASSLKRKGRWTVPRRLSIETRSGSVKLDFTEAVFTHNEVEVQIQAKASSIDLVLPRGGSADVDGLDNHSSSVRLKVPAAYDTHGFGVVLRINGELRSSSVCVRYQRRFWWWRW
ncbi:DUF1707 domain-containing protein [Dactylosporangium roseum]|uniref:DUF1707 domain-containing protein n=1 Tax=Dactylosporangium roseum TaxID=47989 RepID=A0ABY5Z4F6_9ACTN|nr:DUF1707 domain-containing protein [Dactylosporangium roseum]UWZ36722.1 DUF1707 domain-containing protein [Dactylosporangium roseum]